MKVMMKLKRRHPYGAMTFKRHSITYALNEFELNEEEVELLEGAEAKHWFEVSKPMKKKSPSKKAE